MRSWIGSTFKDTSSAVLMANDNAMELSVEKLEKDDIDDEDLISFVTQLEQVTPPIDMEIESEGLYIFIIIKPNINVTLSNPLWIPFKYSHTNTCKYILWNVNNECIKAIYTILN